MALPEKLEAGKTWLETGKENQTFKGLILARKMTGVGSYSALEVTRFSLRLSPA